MSGELGMSCYVGRVVVLTLVHPFLMLHLLSTYSIPSTSAPMLLLGTHEWAGTAREGSRSVVIEQVVDDAKMIAFESRLAEFETPLDSDPIRFAETFLLWAS